MFDVLSVLLSNNFDSVLTCHRSSNLTCSNPPLSRKSKSRIPSSPARFTGAEEHLEGMLLLYLHCKEKAFQLGWKHEQFQELLHVFSSPESLARLFTSLHFKRSWSIRTTCADIPKMFIASAWRGWGEMRYVGEK